ncbi:MAG: TatD family hydrolase [Acholeplasmataceae bacterium]
MIDTHAHLNIKEFSTQINEILNRAKAQGVKKIIVIGMDEETNEIAVRLAEQYQMLYASVGIHPGYVENGETQSIIKWLKHPKVVAIGECGIDLYWNRDNFDLQKKIFIEQIELAKEYKLPLIIHTRNSFTEAYDCLLPYKNTVTGVFHCFSSSLEDAKKAIDLNFYLGVDGPITFPKSTELRELVEAIDLKHWLIETDSPYLAPVPYRGKKNEPSNLKFVAQSVADVKKTSLMEVVDRTTNNAYQLFKFGGRA